MGRDDDDEHASKPHPFVRLVKFVGKKVSRIGAGRRAKYAEQAEAEAAQEEEERQLAKQLGHRRKKKKKKGGRFQKLLFWRKNKDEEDDDDSSEEGDSRRNLDDQGDYWGDLSGSGETDSEEWDPNQDDDDDDQEDYVDAFRPGELGRAAYNKDPIERLGPEDIKELEETMHRMNPKYKKAETAILEEKMERAVSEQLKRLRKSNCFNARIAFGPAGRQIPLNLGNVKIPTLICVTGHHGMGGNAGINGVYERYPDDYHGRVVYQKYLERDEWLQEPQAIEFRNGAQAWAIQDLDDESGGRTFPTIHDTPRTKLAMKHTMVSAKVLPLHPDPDAVGHFRWVDKTESWFLFWDDLIGAWCIGPKPGSGYVFARCFGVDEALPDNLGPDRWQVFDVGHRKWYTHKNLRTYKGGTVSSALGC